MATETLIIVVGGDYLAYEICREILQTAGQRVALIWKHEEEHAARLLARTVERFRSEHPATFSYHALDPTEAESLREAGLEPPDERTAQPEFCIVAVSQDDRLNLRVALLARDVNDRTRVTLRQFNPVLGHKIQEGLKYNCIVISPAAHAAATYAAAAVDPSCYYAVPFASAGLFGFFERQAADFGIDGMDVAAAERHLHARIVAIDGDEPYLCQGIEDCGDVRLAGAPIAARALVCAFGPIAHVKRTWPQGERPREISWHRRVADTLKNARVSLRRVEPILLSVFGAGFVLYLCFALFFAIRLGLNPIASLYFVMSTMTTVGYGDITPCQHCATAQLGFPQAVNLLVAMATMLVGVTIFAVVTATVTSALGAATARRTQGLRPIHRAGHVIVCGAGNVGSLVIEYLRALGEHVVVVEKNPDAILVELARDHKVDLLTADATNDEAIAYCSPELAKALVGVTNSDTANLEVALGARTRLREQGRRGLEVVLRIDDLAFGASIKRHFDIRSFSTTELTAPTIAGLVRVDGARGRFATFATLPFSRAFELQEQYRAAGMASPAALLERGDRDVRWVPLYVWREREGDGGVALPVHKFEGEVRPGDRLLFMVPLEQFTP